MKVLLLSSVLLILVIGLAFGQTNTNSFPEVLPTGANEAEFGPHTTWGWVIMILASIVAFLSALFHPR